MTPIVSMVKRLSCFLTWGVLGLIASTITLSSPGCSGPPLETWHTAKLTAEFTAEMAAELNIRVALYPHLLFAIAKMPHSLFLIKKVDHPNLGVIFNLFHFLKFENAADLLTFL